MNRLEHEFYDHTLKRLNKHDGLIVSDICIICNLVLERNHFNKIGYKTTHQEVKNLFNKLYPCLTEEEYIIKKFLE